MDSSTGKVTERVVAMLREHRLDQSAQAVNKAVGVVDAKRHGGVFRYYYSANVNRRLCEALFYLNSLPRCNNNHKLFLKSLIREYREVNGITAVADIDGVDVDETVEEEISVANDDMARHILDETEVGEEYNVADIFNDYFGGGPAEESVEEYDNDGADDEEPVEEIDLSYVEIPEMTEDLLSCIRELVSLGYFEILERDEVNGHPSVVKRVQW